MDGAPTLVVDQDGSLGVSIFHTPRHIDCGCVCTDIFSGVDIFNVHQNGLVFGLAASIDIVIPIWTRFCMCADIIGVGIGVLRVVFHGMEIFEIFWAKLGAPIGQVVQIDGDPIALCIIIFNNVLSLGDGAWVAKAQFDASLAMRFTWNINTHFDETINSIYTLFDPIGGNTGATT